MTKHEILEDLAHQDNISIDNWTVPFAKATIIAYNGTYGIVIDLAQVSSAREETMILAHELGHFVTGTVYREKSRLHNFGKSERRAAEWAINFLVDFEQLKEYVSEGHDVHFVAEMMGLHPEVIARAIQMKHDEWVTDSEL